MELDTMEYQELKSTSTSTSTMEYQELRSGDSLASYLAYDCDGLMDSDKSAKLPREVTGGGAGAGLVKMLQSKSHKIILQERSWHTLHQQNIAKWLLNWKYCILFKDWSSEATHLRAAQTMKDLW